MKTLRYDSTAYFPSCNYHVIENN